MSGGGDKNKMEGRKQKRKEKVENEPLAAPYPPPPHDRLRRRLRVVYSRASQNENFEPLKSIREMAYVGGRTKCSQSAGIHDRITCARFDVDRLKSLGVACGEISGLLPY